jgi:hypothetical protein
MSNNTRLAGLSFQNKLAFMKAIMKFAIFSFYTFSFYIGSFFIQRGFYNNQSQDVYGTQDILVVIIALITGFLSLIAALPHVQGI